MRFHHEHLWSLSYEELAGLARELGHDHTGHEDPLLRDEAKRLEGGWADALAINRHAEGGAERQANMAAALRKRTIELMVKSGQVSE